MRGFAVLALFAAVTWPVHAGGRVMSINLCADVFALQLLPRAEIQSVSFLAATSPLSPVRERARGVPTNRATLEEILLARPRLVLAHRYSSPLLLERLRAFGIPFALIEAPETVAAAARQWTELGAVLGASQTAARWQAQLAPLLAANDGLAAAPLAAVYGPNGLSVGPGNLLHDLLRQAGFRNLGARLGLGSIGTLPLEALLLAQPQLLVLTRDAARADALSDRALRHPALRRLGHRQELTLPSQYSNCGGPELIDALRELRKLRIGLES